MVEGGCGGGGVRTGERREGSCRDGAGERTKRDLLARKAKILINAEVLVFCLCINAGDWEEQSVS